MGKMKYIKACISHQIAKLCANGMAKDHAESNNYVMKSERSHLLSKNTQNQIIFVLLD